MNVSFADRLAAGRALADALTHYGETRYGQTRDWRAGTALVLALPRGGVPVADQVAQRLNADLDVMIVRKLGLPGQEELAMGAIASGDVRVLNREVLHFGGIDEAALERVTAHERAELERRQRAYRGDRPWPRIEGRRVILVDDGIATGATMLAAVGAVRKQQPQEIIVAVPVAPADTVHRFRDEADSVVCLATPAPFFGVGQWYRDFSQTSDEEVCALLAAAWRREAAR
jgi:putative phosphoribosyl transferase